MNDLIWKLIAKIVTRPAVFTRLLRYGWAHPYSHITSKDGTDVYMARYWLFNPYPETPEARKKQSWLRRRLPSVRLHNIRRADNDRHLHDHPWNARTIILRGWYYEQRGPAGYIRRQGDTATLAHGEFHRIDKVAPETVWTLFITWEYRGTWGFLVGDKKVPYRDYQG